MDELAQFQDLQKPRPNEYPATFASSGTGIWYSATQYLRQGFC